ncbi:MAG: GGDEF domain-containing protein [Synechococcaceae cyanobacterium SM2_3_60]|nr:GGDEF domain-containing protein [Synechococcaceae cyanobacterium SM2_3_60]
MAELPRRALLFGGGDPHHRLCRMAATVYVSATALGHQCGDVALSQLHPGRSGHAPHRTESADGLEFDRARRDRGVTAAVSQFAANPLGKRHLRLMFMLFSLIVSSIEPIVQVMGQAAPLDLLHWNLVFFFQATLIPVLWPLHLASQLLAIASYGLLHVIGNLPLPAASWHESLSNSGIRLIWICLLPTISVLLYERLARSEFRSRLLMQAQQAQLTASNQVLTELSQVDPLTKLHNRRYFDQVLQQEWQRHLREQQSLAVLLMDVDFFKRYNDTYGHPAGDRCLQTVAESINKGIKRASDVVARYGGEEFIVLLPNTDREGATLVADCIRFHLRLIPPRPILIFQQHQLAVRADAGLAPGIVQQHQRQQTARLRAVGIERQQVHQNPPQPNRLHVTVENGQRALYLFGLLLRIKRTDDQLHMILFEH